MTPIEQQLQLLREKYPAATAELAPSGAHLITIPEFRLPPGWNQDVVTLMFLAPPGYPAAQPDCFWIAPVGIRLQNGATPQNTNDANPIPEFARPSTWFSWHLQHWSPNSDSLMRYLNVIRQRLSPAR